MATRFDKYRMKDGKTPLAETYFNGVFQDLDTRLAALEEKRISFEDAVAELTGLGLERINEVLTPSLNGLADALAEVESRRLELTAAIDAAEATLGEIVTQDVFTDGMAALETTLTGQIVTLQESVDGQIAAVQTDLDERFDAAFALACAAL